jgi:sugar lactone lactonase YvrE
MATRAERQVDVVVDGLFFPEAPRWRDGHLFVSDFYDHLVLAIEPDGTSTVVCEVPGQPSGLGFAPNGDLLVVSMTDRRLLRVRGGELVVVADLGGHAPADCNDMYVDGHGRAYIGNFGSDLAVEPVRATSLLRVDPDGSVSVAAEDVVFPNGVIATPAGTMLLAETFAYRVSEFDVGPDGTLANRRTWASFGNGPARDMDEILAASAIAPDGICLDVEGALWVADATGDGASRVLPGGEVVDRVVLDGLTAFAVALGGEDGRTLYLCAGPPLGQVDPAAGRRGSVLATRVEVPGLGL